MLSIKKGGDEYHRALICLQCTDAVGWATGMASRP